MSRRGYAAVISVLTLLVAFMGSLVIYGEFGVGIRGGQPIVLQIRSGETLRHLAGRLGREGTLPSPMLFTLLGVLRGDSGRIKAGEYVMKGGISPNSLLDDLVMARARFLALTIPEGFSLAEIAARMDATELANGANFLRLAHDPKFIATLGLPFKKTPPTLEGLIFPETYYFHRGVPEADLIVALVNQFKKRAAGLLLEKSSRVGLTPYEVLILASMIEKETGAGEERTLISAVFHNRLSARMRLASDPTVIYGLGNFDGNLKRVHLRTKTPYNTYRIGGLPPTPIANPGLGSIRAAVDPAKVDYLYFVSKGNGTHFFSKDFRSHNQAVWKYQIKPNRKRKS